MKVLKDFYKTLVFNISLKTKELTRQVRKKTVGSLKQDSHKTNLKMR